MRVKRSKYQRRSFFLILVSIALLLINLNFNVRTFRLTQSLQTLTINLQNLERDINLKELTFYQKTRLDQVYEKASTSLGMIRQPNIHPFTNQPVTSR